MSIQGFRRGDVGKTTERVVSWRRHLHRNPELSFKERETADFVFETLSSFPGLSLKRPTPTSVVATLAGGAPGKTIAIRADMDALPIQEETELPYASRMPGVMHACGHDSHTAMLLAAAQVLSEEAESLRGEIRFVFQHAEEVLPGGASEVLASGALDGVDFIVGAHVMPQFEAGSFGVVSGPAMASPDIFEAEIIGKGGHAAMPHTTVDPIAIGAEVVSAFQRIISRGTNPLDSAVLSVTQFIAGTAFNVIPSTARLVGTVRTFTAATRKSIREQMERVLAGITVAHGANYRLKYLNSFPPVNNDPELTAAVERSIGLTMGEGAVRKVEPLMAGEDFAVYQQKIPGCFYFVGVGNQEKGITFPLHHPRFDLDEGALILGVRVLVGIAADVLSAQGTIA